MRGKPSPGLRAYGVVVGTLLILPTLVVIPMSFSASEFLSFPPKGLSLVWYREFFADPVWMAAVGQSLQVAACTTVLSVVLGIMTALGLIRGRFRGKSALQVLVLSPMIMPLVVLAVGLFFVYSDWRILGSLGGLILAHTVIAYPLVYIAVSTSLQGMDQTLEQAAASLGANRWYAFRTVTLPLIAPGVLTGALFAFTTSWDELILSIFLSSPIVKTLPVVMWQQVQTELSPTLAVAATLVMVTTIVLVAAAAWVATRRKVVQP
ncbi:putative spermidine/putrescine transport system permease protein [Murinocardiopsis flavida]|uniref:Putative spermidine/putrescine transport system permease protein n=1 Tax=Murinocardiopsis flavida TaxID=645275 RepID=A0A2P8DUK3_9ACTN|nr:ABC transporter permease [Murinocardiopsis flavida]PSL00900.1 putative spermidine/putrescine transport system permease protein [Murinocardiopsis flavida]